MPSIVEPDASTAWILATLQADAVLTAMQVTVNGALRTLQGVFYMAAPQETENPYPSIIVESPYQDTLAQRMHPNGWPIGQASLMHDVAVHVRDVEPNDSALKAIRARAITVLAGKSGTVTGGRTNGCLVDSFPPDQRIDKGSYIYTRIGVTFKVAAQVT